MSQPQPQSQPTLLLPCPACGKPSDCLKMYRTITMVFLVFAVWWRKRDVVACPKCMKGKLLEFAGINIATANLAWPIVILPAAVAYWMDLATPGPSTNLLEMARGGRWGSDTAAIATEILAQPRVKHPALVRFFGMGLMFLGFAAILATVIFLTTEWYELGSRRLPVLALCAAIGGVASALFVWGTRRLRLRALGGKWFAVWMLAGALSFAAVAPLIGMGYWRWYERSEARDDFSYLYGVPRQVWRPEPLRRIVDRLCSGDGPSRQGIDRLKDVLRGIETHHGGDPEFAAIADDVRKAIAKWTGGTADAYADRDGPFPSAGGAPGPQPEPAGAPHKDDSFETKLYDESPGHPPPSPDSEFK